MCCTHATHIQLLLCMLPRNTERCANCEPYPTLLLVCSGGLAGPLRQPRPHRLSQRSLGERSVGGTPSPRALQGQDQDQDQGFASQGGDGGRDSDDSRGSDSGGGPLEGGDAEAARAPASAAAAEISSTSSVSEHDEGGMEGGPDLQEAPPP